MSIAIKPLVTTELTELPELTERQRRELEYHREYAESKKQMLAEAFNVEQTTFIIMSLYKFELSPSPVRFGDGR